MVQGQLWERDMLPCSNSPCRVGELKEKMGDEKSKQGANGDGSWGSIGVVALALCLAGILLSVFLGETHGQGKSLHQTCTVSTWFWRQVQQQGLPPLPHHYIFSNSEFLSICPIWPRAQPHAATQEVFKSKHNSSSSLERCKQWCC